MNVLKEELTTVTVMLTAIISRGASTALVKMDSLEMDFLVHVRANAIIILTIIADQARWLTIFRSGESMWGRFTSGMLLGLSIVLGSSKQRR